ncbi:MAG: hypothetical protein WAM97_17430 [Acidimicrobiales bacterium]
MAVDNVDPPVPNDPGQLLNQSRIWDSGVERTVWIRIIAPEEAAPPGDAVHRDSPFNVDTGQPVHCGRYHIYLVAPLRQCVGKLLDVQLETTQHGRVSVNRL